MLTSIYRYRSNFGIGAPLMTMRFGPKYIYMYNIGDRTFCFCSCSSLMLRFNFELGPIVSFNESISASDKFIKTSWSISSSEI